MPLTEQETEFYQRLANVDHWRERCAYCGCPKWAHATPHPTKGATLGGCGCGQCNYYTFKRQATDNHNQ